MPAVGALPGQVAQQREHRQHHHTDQRPAAYPPSAKQRADRRGEHIRAVPEQEQQCAEMAEVPSVAMIGETPPNAIRPPLSEPSTAPASYRRTDHQYRGRSVLAQRGHHPGNHPKHRAGGDIDPAQ